MPQFNDLSIRAKLYGMVAVSAGGLAVVLGVALWVLHEYRVGGPVYEHLIARKNSLSEVDPATFLLSEPYFELYRINTTTDADEVRRLVERYRDAEKRCRERQ